MICERCNQEIVDGELYHRAFKRGRDDGDDTFMTITGSVIVHDYPCPNRVTIADGRVMLGEVDMGPVEAFGIASIELTAE